MASSTDSLKDGRQAQLKDPFIAGVLGWLIPGLGHFYQGRTAKGALFAICILGTFIYGLYLGGSPEIGWGRSVYFCFDKREWRWPWFFQAGVGFPTVPLTLLQWQLRDRPVLYKFMAPPAEEKESSLPNDQGPQVVEPRGDTLKGIQRMLPRYFDMATVYTMIAGLLNILAVYDACCGPVPAEAEKKDEKEPDAGTGGTREKKP